jgi:hypothetical protein
MRATGSSRLMVMSDTVCIFPLLFPSFSLERPLAVGNSFPAWRLFLKKEKYHGRTKKKDLEVRS